MKPTDAPGKSVRLLRIGEQVRHAVADLLARREVRDPVLENAIISVSEVRVTPDLRRRSSSSTRSAGPTATRCWRR